MIIGNKSDTIFTSQNETGAIMNKPQKITTAEMELVVARFFSPRVNLVVPNVHWGMDLSHECDLLVLSPAGYATEIEIKVSKSDLIRDKDKGHGHNSYKIKYLYFAIPRALMEFQEHIPERAGILVVEPFSEKYTGLTCRRIRMARAHNNYKFNAKDRLRMSRLGALRIWDLKESIAGLIKNK